MGAVSLFPSAIQPVVRGALWFPLALLYFLFGALKLVGGIIALPFGA